MAGPDGRGGDAAEEAVTALPSPGRFGGLTRYPCGHEISGGLVLHPNECPLCSPVPPGTASAPAEPTDPREAVLAFVVRLIERQPRKDEAAWVYRLQRMLDDVRAEGHEEAEKIIEESSVLYDGTRRNSWIVGPQDVLDRLRALGDAPRDGTPSKEGTTT